MNYYTYCINNPLKYTDPNGHGFLSDLAGAIVVIALLVALILLLAAITPVTVLCFAIAAAAYIVACAEYGEVTMTVWKDKHGAIVGREWRMGNGSILGGYYQREDHWMVWSSTEQRYIAVPLDQWKPPYNPENEPVTIEKFPPQPSSSPNVPTQPKKNEEGSPKKPSSSTEVC